MYNTNYANLLNLILKPMFTNCAQQINYYKYSECRNLEIKKTLAIRNKQSDQTAKIIFTSSLPPSADLMK